MKKSAKYPKSGIAFISFLTTIVLSLGHSYFMPVFAFTLAAPQLPPDTSDLRYPFEDTEAFPYGETESTSPLMLDDPSNIESSVEYNVETGEYEFRRRIGAFDYRPPVTMSLEEYREYQMNRAIREYWRQQAQSRGQAEGDQSLIPSINFGGEAFDKIFGSNTINITPQGSAELVFGYNMSRIDNPNISERLRKTPSFTFEEKIQMNLTGSIGDKMNLGINYNTEATFDFENRTKLGYEGDEDEIIKKIEAGNVNLPLTGSLITGSQSLFGLKTELQFGKLSMTSVFSQQKGETSVIEVAGGAQVNEYEVRADEYDANKHFFLSHYFKDTYNRATSNLPVINSGVNITRVEVWITNRTSNFDDARNIIALTDLGEGGDNIYNDAIPGSGGTPFPRNVANELYSTITGNAGIRNVNEASDILNGLYGGMRIGYEFEKIENAQQLTSREYELNERLGYISLNRALNADEVLAVAYQYTLNGRTYQVGEFSTDGVSAPDALMVKLLKGTNLSPRVPTWELMMKNIYAIGAYQIDQTEFVLDVLYENDETGTAINYIPEEQVSKDLLLTVMNLDNVNSQLDPYPDGVFDYIQGITVYPSNGRIIFPVLEPFGEGLKAYFQSKNVPQDIQEKYLFMELYDSTHTQAEQIADKNKFILAGTYRSSVSSEIPLNAMNVPQGSVTVSAGGVTLQENVDYTVDYTLGRVKIINQGLLESGTPIRISLESNSLFAIQTKTLVGTHFNYQFSDKFNVGATVLNLTERPLTQKVNIGDEPISNTIWGLNSSYETESQLLTTLIDKIPLIETKETSLLTFDGEFAQLIPGSSKAIGKDGVSYIDDFEGSETSIELKSFPAWNLASAPRGENQNLFPETEISNSIVYGLNRAKLAWYVIDPLFLRNNSLTPGHIKSNPDAQSSHFVREILERELFPNRESPNNIPTNLAVLNVAYYPTEKGPYNYDVLPGDYSAGINEEGLLNEPEERWGGMMREIQTNDFEAANVEYIEFWLMNPFVEDSASNGGDLYFNLGDVSEDILRDGRKAFENGLPVPGEPNLVDTTVWGRIPIKQSLVNAFDTDPQSREFQDVGYDGLSDNQENDFFEWYLELIDSVHENSNAYQKALADPSSDNYNYFRDSDYDREGRSILERYKNFNNPDGNSPTDQQSEESYPTSGTTLPDLEDINLDNTLSEGENYFQYRVSLRPEDLEVGQNFIVDKVEPNVEFENGEKSSVEWFQFRIPISEYEKTVGSIQDFQSIRFMRLFLTNFSDSVILRFATLELVRGEWRKYNLPLQTVNEGPANPQPSEGNFEVSAVNIEENSDKDPVNYVLPPGIDRVIDPTNPQLRQLNEQAMVLRVQDLPDNDARAVFKNVGLDMRQYKKLQMEIHGEEIPGTNLQDGDLSVFIRLGTDYKDNYYEYEIPLIVTPPGDYNNDDGADRRAVWPEENSLDLALSLFQQVKQARNDAMRREGSTVNFNTIYQMEIQQGEVLASVRVSGNPNLSNVRTIMLGVRNPGDRRNPFPNDKMSKSGEIWFNELRLTDFNDNGGWAANARATARLADFGSLTLAGSISTPGFGSIEKKVNERSVEEMISYDITTNLELGKFFPEESGVSIPTYIGYSETFINPQYNPLDPDIPLKAALENMDTEAERDSLRNIAQDYTRRKSLNFTNVKINRQGNEKAQIYDLSNWAATYSYNETFMRNIKTEYNTLRKYRGALSYNFSTRPKNIAPLNKVSFLNKPVFSLIKDFNFYYYPSNISFRTDLNRQYNEIKLRNLNNPDIRIAPTVRKDFTWNRYYDLKFDLTKSLKFDFSATNIARIDEPLGPMDKRRDDYEAKRDSIIDELMGFGRTINYQHSFNVSYNVPINKIPGLKWTSLNTRYNGTYAWDVGPITADTIQLGNAIKNSNSLQVNGQLNFQTLYGKVGFLKKIEQETSGRQKDQEQPKKTVTYERRLFNLQPGDTKSISHRLGTEDVEVIVTTEDGRQIEGDVEVRSENRLYFTASDSAERVLVTVNGQVDAMRNPLVVIGKYLVRAAMGVRSISISYAETEGTMLPGYLPKTTIFGMQNYQNNWAPGVPFIMGWQDEDFPYRAANEYNWLTTDSLLTSPLLMTHNENFNLRANIEPLPDLRIDLNASRTYSRNVSEYFGYNTGTGETEFDSRIINGNFSMSTITVRTAFENSNAGNNYSSEAFNNFKEYRKIISDRLARERVEVDPTYNPNAFFDPELGEFIPAEEGYNDGYGPTSSQVLIPAFLAAYTGFDPENITTETFPNILSVLPNWRISYDGLSKIPFVKKYLRSLTMGHAYRSSYNIGSYTSNPNFDPEIDDPLSFIRDEYQNNFLTQYQINVVSITEQFSPLINFDMAWHNSLTTRIEFKQSRNLSLSFANNQLTEITSKEYVIGAGYRFNQVPIVIRTGGGETAFESDLNIRADLSIRDNKTILRKLVEDFDDITAGQRIVTIKFTADYMLSDRFNLRFFFDRVVNDPFVLRSFPTANTNVGFSVRFTLAE